MQNTNFFPWSRFYFLPLSLPQMIICGVCKTILRKVITFIGKTASKVCKTYLYTCWAYYKLNVFPCSWFVLIFSQEEINQKLDRICKKIRISGCQSFLQKYKNKVVNSLISGDKAGTICIKLKLCKKMDMQTIQ